MQRESERGNERERESVCECKSESERRGEGRGARGLKTDQTGHGIDRRKGTCVQTHTHTNTRRGKGTNDGFPMGALVRKYV